MSSTADITDALNAEGNVQLKAPLVRNIMRKCLGLKYKAVQYTEVQANSERCLVLRQQYALILLGLLQAGKRLINVDESWVDQTSYTRRHWRPIAGQPSLARRSVTPRISLIAAIGTDGSVFLSLTQVNTDT